MQKLLDIMARLRDPECGCPWDREQDFGTIAPYTIEEAYEVADAIDRDDLQGLKGELGDLLFQVVFHAQMAAELGAFDFDDVVAAVSDKIVRRHPHVFGNEAITNSDAQREAWEAHKRAEREQQGAHGLLDDVSMNMPALSRALKLGKRAASVGFDWPDSDGVREKIREELDELVAAERGGDPEQIGEEAGDLLFAVANLARHVGADPEESLRRANRKFTDRFGRVEDAVSAGGRAWPDYTPAELEALWNTAKSAGA